MDCSMPSFPVHHQLLELAQTHVHQVSDAIQSSHPLSSPSPAFNLSQQSGSFPVNQFFPSVARVLELQLQHQSFQWIFRTDSLYFFFFFFSFLSISNNRASDKPHWLRYCHCAKLGLIPFKIDWFDLLAVQGTLKSLLQHHSLKASILQCSALFI